MYDSSVLREAPMSAFSWSLPIRSFNRCLASCICAGVIGCVVFGAPAVRTRSGILCVFSLSVQILSDSVLAVVSGAVLSTAASALPTVASAAAASPAVPADVSASDCAALSVLAVVVVLTGFGFGFLVQT